MRFAFSGSATALAIGVLVAAAAGFACSKKVSESSLEAGPTAPTSGPLAHPCSLLPRDDVQPILGSELTQTEDAAGATTDARCLWSVSGGRGFVELHLQNPPKGLAAFRKDNGAGGKPVPGLGEAAYTKTQTRGARVEVYKNGFSFFVQILPPSQGGLESPPLDQASNVARAVAGRL
jgi:hypothetical protein